MPLGYVKVALEQEMKILLVQTSRSPANRPSSETGSNKRATQPHPPNRAYYP